jgi:hypothetical protein
VFNVGPTDPSPWRGHAAAGRGARRLVRDACVIPGRLLNTGVHRIAFHLARGHELVLWVDDVVVFDVRERARVRDGWTGRWTGAVRPELEWRTRVLDELPADR